MAEPTVVVDVHWGERYWYPDDGGEVWVAGYQLVDPVSGRYLGRDAPELEARGLLVAGAAGAAAPSRGRARVRRGRAGAAASRCGAIRTNEHDPNAIAVLADGRAARLGPARARRRAGARVGRRPAVGGGRAARAAALAARSPPRGDAAAGRGRWRSSCTSAALAEISRRRGGELSPLATPMGMKPSHSVLVVDDDPARAHSWRRTWPRTRSSSGQRTGRGRACARSRCAARAWWCWTCCSATVTGSTCSTACAPRTGWRRGSTRACR